MVHDSIKKNAGISESYRNLLKERPLYNSSYSINRELPVIIELVAGKNFDVKVLQEVLKENGLDPHAIYHWQDHYVVFDKVKDAMALKGKIQKVLPGAEVKVYYDAFYDFNRKL